MCFILNFLNGVVLVFDDLKPKNMVIIEENYIDIYMLHT
jgi:hypothetical protein